MQFRCQSNISFPPLADADILLWRNKKVSAGVLGVATLIWVLFELLEYHLLALVCHILIFGLAIVFLWSNASSFINRYAYQPQAILFWFLLEQTFYMITSYVMLFRSRPRIPEVVIPEDIVRDVASALWSEVNFALATLREIASGKDVKSFLAVCQSYQSLVRFWIVRVIGLLIHI